MKNDDAAPAELMAIDTCSEKTRAVIFDTTLRNCGNADERGALSVMVCFILLYVWLLKTVLYNDGCHIPSPNVQQCPLRRAKVEWI